MLSNEKGNVVERYEYEAYGEVTITGPAGKGKRNHSTIGNRFMFTGREYDQETGLYYYRARYYSTELGRFLQRDPAESDKLLHLYAYIENNPIKYVDPLGMWKITRNKTMLRGIAVAESGDTFERLAEMVKLSPAEKNYWLKKVNDDAPLSEKPQAGDKYNFPNTVYIVVGNSSGTNLLEIDTVRRVFTRYSLAMKRDAEEQGFYTLYNSDTTKNSMIHILEDSKRNANIWGLGFFGHGESPRVAVSIGLESGDTY